jgi:hypothetical protein
MEYGSRGVCATPAVNDPGTIQEAWMNTESQHPGLIAAMRQRSLQKGSAALSVGDQNVFWVYNISKRSFDTVRAELKAIGTISYVWVALDEWNNGHVTSNEVDAIENALEHSTSGSSLDSSKGVLQIDRQVYGDPPNINSSFQKGKGDGKTHFLICDIQDGWTPGGSYVAGFFYSVDVDPNSGTVNTSNKRDMLYIDSYPGIYFSGQRRTSVALSTLAHEFQHLIHWNYNPSEITFFNEGLSEYAESLCGYPLRSPAGYFGNANVMLTGWTSTVEDYSRAALWTRFISEQYGLGFIRNFTQNVSGGILGFEQSVSKSGYSRTFASTAVNFFTANWLGATGSDSTYRYKTPLSLRPSLKMDFVDPNVQRVDTVVLQGAQYVSFASARNFRITFTLPAGVSVRGIESGPSALRVRDVASGLEYTSPELGTQFTSVVFVVSGLQPAASATYSYAAAGETAHFIVEESYDSGTPHAFAPGYAPYIGFGNNATTLGMAVRFQPEVRGNVLHKARMMLAFNQEFSNGTASATDSKNFVFHVWGDQNGRPGSDIIQPFLVSVDRTLYPYGNFVDIDLSAYQSKLTNLAGPVYLGFTEDVGDTVGTYLGVDSSGVGDYSYVYRGPNYARRPNTWETMSEVSAVNNHQFDGYNLMMRAVFEYSDSSAAPALVLGYLQNPLLSEYIDVITASSDDLRAASLTGALTQGAGSSSLKFSGVPGTSKVFIDTTQQLKGSGTVSIRVRGAKRFGVYYADTTVTLNARLLKTDEPTTLSTPSGAVAAIFEAGSVKGSVYLTAFDGLNDPQIDISRPRSAQSVFALGPAGVVLGRGSSVIIRMTNLNESSTLAQYRNGKWIALPSVVNPGQGELSSTINSLGLFSVMNREDATGKAESIPTQFALLQNYPNPFNPSTAISYQLSAISYVNLKIFDILGREVGMLEDGIRQPGVYSIRWDATGMASGVYLYQINATEISPGASKMHVETKKMVLLK